MILSISTATFVPIVIGPAILNVFSRLSPGDLSRHYSSARHQQSGFSNAVNWSLTWYGVLSNRYWLTSHYLIIQLSESSEQRLSDFRLYQSIPSSRCLLVSTQQINLSLDLENRSIDIDWYRIIQSSNWLNRVIRNLCLIHLLVSTQPNRFLTQYGVWSDRYWSISYYLIVQSSELIDQRLSDLDLINISHLLAVSWSQLNQIDLSLNLENHPINIDWYCIIRSSDQLNWVIRGCLTLDSIYHIISISWSQLNQNYLSFNLVYRLIDINRYLY